MPNISFFPPSLPNETFNSRIARYQLIAGNRSVATTFKELFQHNNFSLAQIVPPHLDVLAAQLPGDPNATLNNFLAQNTLLPLFRPFLGTREPGDGQSICLNRLPRHVVGKHGDAYMCVQCMAEAEHQFGFGYWQRSHQAPGVTTCWKHGVLLLKSCPVCQLPFQRRLQLLEFPWKPCPQCKHKFDSATPSQTATKDAVTYARFVHDLLYAELQPIAPDLLAKIYRQRIQKIGFVWGQKNSGVKLANTRKRLRSTSMTAFTEDLIEKLGHDFIAQVDPAFAAGRTTFWLRFSIVGGVMDMPLQRHILLIMRLFDSVIHFKQKIVSTEHDLPVTPSLRSRHDPSADTTMRHQHRQRIVREIKIDPNITLEGLWRKAYRPTAWLFEHDKKWLDSALTHELHTETIPENTSITEEDKLRDLRFAKAVELRASQLVSQDGKPVRVTRQRLLDALPISSSHLKLNSYRYPILYEKISSNRESSWSLSARRLLWAIGELQHLGLNIAWGNIATIASVSYYALRRIAQFARWELEDFDHKAINIPNELARVGIGLTWQGPEAASWHEIGGRSYKQITLRKSNKDDSLRGF